jgi:alpha-tubulin suppressor-like RCC1 family protein
MKPTKLSVPGVTFTKTVSGGLHSAALTNQGEVYTWGSGASGRLGHGDDADSLVPKRVEYFTQSKIKVVSLSAGGGHTLALADNGKMYVWGYNGNGRLGFGDTIDRYE